MKPRINANERQLNSEFGREKPKTANTECRTQSEAAFHLVFPYSRALAFIRGFLLFFTLRRSACIRKAAFSV
jgi:hypothetical protein